MRALLLLALVAASGCSAFGSDEPSALAWGLSFGECLGYCTARLTVTSDGAATLTETPTRGSGLTTRVRTRVLTAEERDRLDAAEATSTVATTTLGCPDCADGGAEYVERGGARTTFEYGGDAGAAAPLAGALRAVRETFPRLD